MTRLFDMVRPAWRGLALPGSCGLVATSGGPDSQALLDIAAGLRAELGWRELHAVGVDHGLRPAARAELGVAESLAAAHGIRFHCLAVQVDRTENVLAAARKARYRALLALAKELGADWIAVGHTATDQVETILLNLTRGASLRSAAGIRPRNGRIIRPLLEVSRAQILEHLAAQAIAFAEDPSNRDPQRVRAQLRATVLPALAQINPRFEHGFARFAHLARLDEELLANQADDLLREYSGPLGSLRLATLTALPIALGLRVLRAWLHQHGRATDHKGLRRLLSACRQGRVAQSFGGADFRSDGGFLWRLQPEQYAYPLAAPGRVDIREAGICIRAELHTPLAGTATQLIPPADGDRKRVAFDLDRLHLPLEVRSWRTGDFLEPFGGRGSTKVGDMFTDTKLPRALRTAWPLLTTADEVLWVVGIRRGSMAPVDGATRQVVVFSVEGELPWPVC